jgi:hypothetical protein
LDLTGTNLSLTGTVAATNGGTGTATVTTGDLLYGSGTNTWGKLAAGGGYKSLVMNADGTQVEWNAVALNQSGAVSGALGATNGGTGQSAYVVGDILYSGTTNTLSKLAGNTTTTKKFLVQTGTGSASAAPLWDTVSGSDVSGAVTTATNLAGGAANQIAYQSGSGATGFVAAPTTSNTALVWNGSSLGWGSAGASITNDTTTNATYYPVWANGTSGSLTTAYVSSTKLSFNPSTGVLTATGFSGPLTGNVTGNVSGSSGSCTGNAATATTAGNITAYTVNQSVGTGNNVQFNSVGVGTAGSGTAGEIRATNNITAYYSDERLKTKIGDIQNPLAKVHEIKTMLYHANEVAVALGYDASIVEVGLSAQSVQRVQPEAVAPAPIDDKYLTVRYERLVPLLIEAIKALDAKVDALAKELK